MPVQFSLQCLVPPPVTTIPLYLVVIANITSPPSLLLLQGRNTAYPTISTITGNLILSGFIDSS